MEKFISSKTLKRPVRTKYPFPGKTIADKVDNICKTCSVGNGVASFIRPCINFLLFTVFVLGSIHQISDDARRRLSEHLWIMFARASPGDPMPLFLLPHEGCTGSKRLSLYSAANNLVNKVFWKIKRISNDRIPRFNPLIQKQEEP